MRSRFQAVVRLLLRAWVLASAFWVLEAVRPTTVPRLVHYIAVVFVLGSVTYVGYSLHD